VISWIFGSRGLNGAAVNAAGKFDDGTPLEGPSMTAMIRFYTEGAAFVSAAAPE